MLRRITYSIVQSRGIKHTVDIKWIKPEYVPAYKPKRSGDLESLPPIPEHALGQYYAMSEEIKNAPEAVKTLFSVAFLGRKEYNQLVKNEIMDRVRRHQYDYSSTEETNIARMTGHIRCLQETMEKYPRGVTSKKAVQELINKRKKLMKLLRQYDYKRFEWLLEKLNLEYKAHPESHHKLSRKESLKKLTEMHCDEIRNKKLEEYRNLLDSQKGPFLTEKLEALKFIRSEQKDLDLPITVTEQDIKRVEKQLEEWKIKDESRQLAKRKKKTIILDSE